MNTRFASMFMLIAVCSISIVLGQQFRGDNAAADNSAVFPPNPDADKIKRSILQPIADISGAAVRPPNVVLILADDLGYADIGSYGSETIPTPHIDRLRKQSVRFTNAYVTAASCSPSRAGLLSGRYQQRFGFEFNTSNAAITNRLQRGLDPTVVTLADVLQKAGYVTGMFGKWHLGTRPHLRPQLRGFDQFYGFLGGAHSFFPGSPDEPIFSTVMRGSEPVVEPEYLTDAIARETVRFIDQHHDEPFFAYIPFNAVHTPIEATKKYQDRFPNEANEKQRDYNAMTSALDDAVGAITAALNEHELVDNTLVIFFNDNGGPTYTGVQNNGNLKLGKLFLFEGGIRVPLIISFPGVAKPDSTFTGITSALDLFPTICSAARIDLPETIPLDGVDLIPYLKGDTRGDPHEVLFWSNGPNIAVRQANWKLVKSYDNIWLFDLAKDEGETENLANRHPQIVEDLEQAYRQCARQMAEPAWPSKPQRQKINVDGMIYELNI